MTDFIPLLRCSFYLLIGAIFFLAFSSGHVMGLIAGGHDKLAHIAAFFILSFAMKIAFPICTAKKIFFAMMLLSAGIEITQYLFTHREWSIIDFMAGIFGVLVYLTLLRIKKMSLRVIARNY